LKSYPLFKADAKPFDKLSPDEAIEKIIRLFSDYDLETFKKNCKFDLYCISFTRDNFLKLAFIYLRIRVGIHSRLFMG
jgi:hypothetical protein